MRQLGLQVIKLIQLIRYFKAADGLSIFFSLLSSNKTVTVNSSKFKNPVYLRKSQSDIFIFEQVFCELQYNYPESDNQKPKNMIDAGANIGMSALYFATKYPDLKIICVEPDAENFNLLKKNTINYPNIQCRQAALWGKNEQVIIYNELEFSAGYMVSTPTNKLHSASIDGITIQFLMEQSHMKTIDILKIDIEGAEKEIFEANTDWLKYINTLVIELHDWLKPGISKLFFNVMKDYDWITYIKGENIVCVSNCKNKKTNA